MKSSPRRVPRTATFIKEIESFWSYERRNAGKTQCLKSCLQCKDPTTSVQTNSQEAENLTPVFSSQKSVAPHRLWLLIGWHCKVADCINDVASVRVLTPSTLL